MSIELMARVWRIDVEAKEKLVLLALADTADAYGMNSYPSMALISQKTSIPERTLQRIVGALIRRSVLTRVHRLPTVELVNKRWVKRPRRIEYRFNLEGLDPAPEPDYTNCPAMLRRATIEVFEETCQHCGGRGTPETGPDRKPWQVDRIIPGSRGGKYVPDNVTLSCAACNLSRGAKMAPPTTTSLGARIDDQGAIPGPAVVPPTAPNPSVVHSSGDQELPPPTPPRGRRGGKDLALQTLHDLQDREAEQVFVALAAAHGWPDTPTRRTVELPLILELFHAGFPMAVIISEGCEFEELMSVKGLHYRLNRKIAAAAAPNESMDAIVRKVWGDVAVR